MAKRISAEFQNKGVGRNTTRWTLTVPKIKRTFFIDGIRYYETEDSKKWQADIFDLKLMPARLPMLMKERVDRSCLKPNR